MKFCVSCTGIHMLVKELWKICYLRCKDPTKMTGQVLPV